MTSDYSQLFRQKYFRGISLLLNSYELNASALWNKGLKERIAHLL